MARTGRLVGRAVASVVSLLDIELVVVGGSVALGFGAPFFAAANTELRARARLSFTSDARIVPSGLGTEGPLVGAGALGWRAADEDWWRSVIDDRRPTVTSSGPTSGPTVAAVVAALVRRPGCGRRR